VSRTSIAIGNNVSGGAQNQIIMGSNVCVTSGLANIVLSPDGTNTIAGGCVNIFGSNSFTCASSNAAYVNSIGGNMHVPNGFELANMFGAAVRVCSNCSNSMGLFATTCGNDSHVFGNSVCTNGCKALVVGNSACSTAACALTFGNSSCSTAACALTFGNSSCSTTAGSQVHGNSSGATGAAGIVIGNSSFARGACSSVLGNSSIACHINSVVLGQAQCSKVACHVHVPNMVFSAATGPHASDACFYAAGGTAGQTYMLCVGSNSWLTVAGYNP